MKCTPAPLARRLAPAAGLLAASLALVTPAVAPAFHMCKDFGGTPLNLSSNQIAGLGGSRTLLTLPEAGAYFDGSGGSDTVDDVDVFVRISHPNVNDLVVWLTHRIPAADPEAPDDVVHVGLFGFDGCNESDWNPNTLFNQDVALYLDDAAPASVIFACDRSIPSLSGRHSPQGPVLIFDPTDVIGQDGLASFSGREIFAGSWELSVVDLSDNNVGESAAVVEWCLAFNTLESGDIAPREETAQLAASQSGNGILTVADHIASALFLLDYLNWDDRVNERRLLGLSSYADTVTYPQPPIALDPTFKAQFINENLFDNLRRGSGTEFLRIDAAPRAVDGDDAGFSVGDGRFTVADWVQITRFAAGNGFDEPAPAGGPIAVSDRIVRAGNTVIPRGQTIRVPIVMRSKGVEHEVGFGLRFDPTVLEYVGVEKGLCLPANANFQLNNVANANTDGILGLQIGLLPDQVFDNIIPDFLCNVRQPGPTLVSNGQAVDGLSLNSTPTRPASLLYEVTTTVADIDFTTDPSTPRVTVALSVDNPIDSPIIDFEIDFVHDGTRLQYVPGSAATSASFSGATPSVSSAFATQEDPAGFRRVRIGSVNSGSTFNSGQLLTLQFDVIVGDAVDVNGNPVIDEDGNVLVSSNAPAVYTSKGSRTVFNSTIVGNNSPFSRASFDNGATNPIQSNPRYALVDAAGGSQTTDCTGQEFFYLDLVVSGNLVPVTDYDFRLVPEGQDENLSFLSAFSIVSSSNDSFGFPRVTVPDGQDRVRGVFMTDPIVDFTGALLLPQLTGSDLGSSFLNGSIVRLLYRKSAAGLDSLLVISARSPNPSNNILFSNSTPIPRHPGTGYTFRCGLSAGKDVAEPPLAWEPEAVEPKAVLEQGVTKAPVQSNGSVTTEILALGSDADGAYLDIGVNVANNTQTVTAFNVLLTFDTLVFAAPAGEAITAGPFGFAPNPAMVSERANYATYSFAYPSQDNWNNPNRLPTPGTENADSTFQNGRLFTARFRIIDEPPVPPSFFVTAIAPVSDEVKLADVLFRARAGQGADASTIEFVNDPLFFNAPSVRGPGGTPLYASFANAGVTVIDNADVRPTVRIQDKVLCPEKLQTVQVVLDSVGIENALGFKVNFDSSRLTLLGIDRGGDIPREGFFYTLPSEEETFPVLNGNETREEVLLALAAQGMTLEQFEEYNSVSILASLQPGDRFTSGTVGSDTKIIANLRFLSRGNDSAESTVFFTELFENSPLLEQGDDQRAGVNSSARGQVVSPEGIALVADFPDGVITIPAVDCTYTVENVSPANATFGPDGGPGVVSVATGATCPFTATSTVPWVRIVTGSNGFGPGAVEYRVEPNDSGNTRTAFIEIGCDSFQITQSGCDFTFNPTVLGFSQFGGTETFEIATSASCSWRLETSDTWVSFVSANIGVGPATITVVVAENPGAPREATISLIDNDGLTRAELAVTQSICNYELSPAEAPSVFPPTGGEGSFQVLTTDICTWQAIAQVDWIEVLDDRGDGSDNTVGYRVLPNTAFPTEFDSATGAPLPRVGTILVSNRFTYTLRQSFPDCSYSTAPAEVVADSREQIVEFLLVTSDEACPWIVEQPAADWISFIDLGEDSMVSGVGSTTFRVALAENTTDQNRRATVSILRGESVVGSFTITQFQSDNHFAFDFLEGEDSGSEGWTSFSPSVFTSPVFDYQETAEVGRGRLCISSTENQNTFGWWESPVLSLTSAVSATDVFEARYLVSSDAASSANVPVFRMRVSTTDFQQSDVYTVSSIGLGPISPSRRNFKEYSTYFTVPGPEFFTNRGQEVRAFFEVLNVDGFDIAGENVCLERLVIQPFDQDTLGVRVSERRYILAQEGIRQFFTPTTVPGVFEAPVFGANERGLTIKSNFTGLTAPPETIGFVTVDTGVEIEANRIYQFVFQVGASVSNALEVRKSLVPTFRVRVNDSSFSSSALVNIESIDDNSRVPTQTTNQRYEVWYRGSAALAGRTLLASFDYLLTPESFASENEFRDAADISLVLEVVEVNSYDVAPTTD